MPRNPNLHKLNEQRLARISTDGWSFRRHHIAWCLLRGRTIDQIESANSCPHTFPSLDDILFRVVDGYRPRAEGQDEAEYLAERNAFLQGIREQLTAWKKQLHLTWLTNEATRRQRNAAKRATPRIHPRPRPESLPTRAARVA